MGNLPSEWVLIRGLLRSQFHWKSFGTELQQQLGLVKVHFVELAGNGILSDQLTPLKIDEAVAQLHTQLPSNLKNYGLLGISLGGMLATRWAQLHPNEVEKLVLINSSSRLSTFTKRLLPKNYVSILKTLASANDEQAEEFVLSTTSNFKEKWQPHLKENINFLKKHPLKYENFVRQLALSTQANFKSIPKCEKLVLCSKADKLVHYSCSEDIAKAWNCDIRFHEGAGHDLPLDDTPWIIEQIKR
jgi:pimeloyl-ACP methyl ester carboxylesterase